MYVDALAGKYHPVAELVALCDLSQTRMNWRNNRLRTRFGLPPRPTYTAEKFDRMVAEIAPETVIVCTMDSAHHVYIQRAMELGCNVITEKPMTIDVEKLRAIYDTSYLKTGKKNIHKN